MSTNNKTVASLEKQIIELQRELDRARRHSTSLWVQIHDYFVQTLGEENEELAEATTEAISEIVMDWVRGQREMITRFNVLRPYTDCLNDLTVSISDPDKEVEVEYGDVGGLTEADFANSFDPLREDYGDYGGYGAPGGSASQGVIPRIPPPPRDIHYPAAESNMAAPPRMMRVNVPKGFTIPH